MNHINPELIMSDGQMKSQSTDLQAEIPDESPKINRKGEVHVIDLRSDHVNNDKNGYKHFLMYREEYSQYIVLKPLRLNNEEEIAEKLLDIFSMIGSPSIINYHNGENSSEKLSEILGCYNALNFNVKLESHADKENCFPLQHNLKQQLLYWKKKNSGKSLQLGLKFLQITGNTKINQATNKTPMQLLFEQLTLPNNQFCIKTVNSTIKKNNLIKLRNDVRSRAERTSTRKSSAASLSQPPLSCPHCSRKFTYPSVLKRHLRSHTDERPYTCEICNKTFKQLGHLRQHVVTHDDQSSHCPICSTKFDSLDLLRSHLSKQHRNKRGKINNPMLQCDICKKMFTTKNVLERHILTHTHERRFDCNMCGKKFKQAGHLKSHILIHTGERNFECSICSKRFSLSNSLKKHMYVHNGEKPYQCDVCGSRFLERRNLNGHLMTHTNDKPFGCKICGKRYTLADTLKRHVSAAHEDGRTYQCEICAKMFKQLAHLSVHKKVHTDERPFQCHVCDKTFKHKNVLKSHLAIHANVRPFECDICKATFVRKTNLQTHIASAHMNQRPYCCKICNKRFKQISHLNGHIIVHSNSLPFQCNYCERRCNRLDNLKKHMKLHEKHKVI